MNPEKIREEQKQDSELLKIIKILSQKGLKPRNVRAYRIDNKCLLVKRINRINEIVIPEELKAKIIQIAHTPHFGLTKTLSLISKHYTWRGIYKDVSNFLLN